MLQSSSPVRKAIAVTGQVTSRTHRDTILFSSFGGQYSDNPRGIYEELVRRGAPLEPVWVAGGSVLPPGVRGVRPRSYPYSRALGQARIVVSNERLPLFLKKPATTYLQTWHGSMLKRIGYDNPRYDADAAGLRRAAKDYERWDLLVSQSPFSTRTMRQAFRYDGEILEVGYPRNDLLLSAEADEVRRNVRAAFGVADDVVLALYAPTFRDDELTTPAPLPLELDVLQKVHGDRLHVLVRLHHRVAALAQAPRTPLWTPTSGYPDIRELFLASDVLITDYSSTMFDYVVTGKPMVFFTHDLARYRDELRGFYFDLTEQAPGPVVTTTEQVAAALGDLDALRSAHEEAYRQFRETYAPWDDGRASARVVDRLLDLT